MTPDIKPLLGKIRELKQNYEVFLDALETYPPVTVPVSELSWAVTAAEKFRDETDRIIRAWVKNFDDVISGKRFIPFGWHVQYVSSNGAENWKVAPTFINVVKRVQFLGLAGQLYYFDDDPRSVGSPAVTNLYFAVEPAPELRRQYRAVKAKTAEVREAAADLLVQHAPAKGKARELLLWWRENPDQLLRHIDVARRLYNELTGGDTQNNGTTSRFLNTYADKVDPKNPRSPWRLRQKKASVTT